MPPSNSVHAATPVAHWRRCMGVPSSRFSGVDVMPHGHAVSGPPEVLAPAGGALPPGAATGTVARPSRHPKGIARATSGPRTMKPSDSVQTGPVQQAQTNHIPAATIARARIAATDRPGTKRLHHGAPVRSQFAAIPPADRAVDFRRPL